MITKKVYRIINSYVPTIMNNSSIFRQNSHNIRSFCIISNENKKNGTFRVRNSIINNTFTLGKFSKYKLASSLDEF